jgi:hypothetical protein
VISLSAWDDPSCGIADDETSFQVLLTVSSIEAALAGPIDIAASDSPVSVRLSMGCYCDFIEGTPEYTLTGTVEFDELSEVRATGDLDLHLEGDVPGGGSMIFERDTTLDFKWNGWVAPRVIEGCN